jgi:hypothetical protein
MGRIMVVHLRRLRLILALRLAAPEGRKAYVPSLEPRLQRQRRSHRMAWYQ